LVFILFLGDGLSCGTTAARNQPHHAPSRAPLKVFFPPSHLAAGISSLL